MSQKSYDNSATLYLIPTPIGNLDDITLRAINTLKEVDFLLTEDTRVTGLLLNHLNIKKKMYASNEYSEEKNIKLVINALNDGKNVGLVSDRGTPVISDPGFEIASAIIKEGYNVVGLPGATALIPALIVSGLNPKPFLFYGFLNSKSSQRDKELEELKDEKETIIFYESPHRIEKTLISIANIFGNRRISISREISKRYEEIYRGNITDIIKEMNNVKGELVIVVEGNYSLKEYSNEDIYKLVSDLVSDGLKPIDAIKEIAKDLHISKSDVYNIYHK